jgi:hypothetical protein
MMFLWVLAPYRLGRCQRTLFIPCPEVEDGLYQHHNDIYTVPKHSRAMQSSSAPRRPQISQNNFAVLYHIGISVMQICRLNQINIKETTLLQPKRLTSKKNFCYSYL